MGIYRMYTGDDGQTHLEEQNVADHPELASARAVTSLTFTERDSGYFIDWHPAPRRQYVICIEGGIEIGLGDGSLHQLRPRRRPAGGGHHRPGPHHPQALAAAKCVTATVPLGRQDSVTAERAESLSGIISAFSKNPLL